LSGSRNEISYRTMGIYLRSFPLSPNCSCASLSDSLYTHYHSFVSVRREFSARMRASNSLLVAALCSSAYAQTSTLITTARPTTAASAVPKAAPPPWTPVTSPIPTGVPAPKAAPPPSQTIIQPVPKAAPTPWSSVQSPFSTSAAAPKQATTPPGPATIQPSPRPIPTLSLSPQPVAAPPPPPGQPAPKASSVPPLPKFSPRPRPSPPPPPGPSTLCGTGKPGCPAGQYCYDANKDKVVGALEANSVGTCYGGACSASVSCPVGQVNIP
jgi:hypothetical protein